jgi:hypothetical protein
MELHAVESLIDAKLWAKHTLPHCDLFAVSTHTTHLIAAVDIDTLIQALLHLGIVTNLGGTEQVPLQANK